jgi:C-terminal processing protease CtpA/Prc
MIRGKKDTIVRLQLITNGNERSVVEIKRDEVKLKDEEARAELVALTRSTYPSLADTDKPEPPSDWS